MSQMSWHPKTALVSCVASHSFSTVDSVPINFFNIVYCINVVWWGVLPDFDQSSAEVRQYDVQFARVALHPKPERL